jgi:hypothetical protein
MATPMPSQSRFVPNTSSYHSEPPPLRSRNSAVVQTHGVHSIMMEKPLFTIIYHHIQSCGVRSSWEGSYTTYISTLPLYVLCGLMHKKQPTLQHNVQRWPDSYPSVASPCFQRTTKTKSFTSALWSVVVAYICPSFFVIKTICCFLSLLAHL